MPRAMTRAGFDLEALSAPQRTGAGALIRVSLFDATAEWMAVPLIHLDYDRAPTRMGLAHPSVAPYGVFATADGKEILIAIQNEREWRRFCAEILGERLKSVGIAFGNFNTVEDFSHHPHLRRIAVDTPEGPVRLLAAPAVFEEHRPSGRVPALGAHTAAIRAEFAK